MLGRKKKMQLSFASPVCLDLASGQCTFRHGTCVVIYLIFLSCSLSLYVPPPAKTWVSYFQQQNTATRKKFPEATHAVCVRVCMCGGVYIYDEFISFVEIYKRKGLSRCAAIYTSSFQLMGYDPLIKEECKLICSK